jgi:hypothetical protein
VRGRRSLPVGVWLVAFGVLSTSRAAAFVDETTGYATGTPLVRPSGCVVLAVTDPLSPDLSRDQLRSATTAAAQAWTDASAGCGGGFRFDVQAATANPGVAGDGVNAVIFHKSNYCGSGSAKPRCDPLSLAITWLYFVNAPGAPDDGRLYEADIEINGEAYDWDLGGDVQAGRMDLQSVLTHELGHVVGLDHNCYEAGFGLPRPTDDQGNPAPTCGDAPPAVSAAVMYPVTSYAVERRTLGEDDVRGICALYPAGTSPTCEGNLSPSGGCSLGGAPPTAGSTTLLASLLLTGIRARRSVRRSRWPRCCRRVVMGRGEGGR